MVLPRFPRRPPAAFTLIEILVVIAIMAALASLIFPLLSSAQKRARQVTSNSNLRQWGVGFISSVSDNNNEMPSDGGDQFQASDETAWFNRIPPKINQTPLKSASASPPKLGQKSLWINPSAPTNAAVTGIPFTYGYNDYLSTTDEPNLMRTRVVFPSKTVLMAEKKTDASPKVNPGNIITYYGSNDPADLEASCNILFLDGHVEEVKRSVFSIPTAASASTDDEMQKAPLLWVPYSGAKM